MEVKERHTGGYLTQSKLLHSVKNYCRFVCIKKFYGSDLSNENKKEIDLLLQHSFNDKNFHENVVRLLGVYEEHSLYTRSYGYVMEFMEDGSLDNRK